MFAPSAGEQWPSPRMIRRRNARLSEWLPLAVQKEGIRTRPGLRASLLGHPGGPLSPWEPLDAEPLASVVDRECAVEEGVDIDSRTRVTPPAGSGLHLEEAAVELHRVVVRDGAPILEGADAREVRRRRPPRGLRRGRGVSEAGIVARAEAVKDALGVGEGPRLRKAEFDDEAILEGAEEPFHAALTLGRGGGDPADPQFLERSADLGGSEVALKLLRQALGGQRIAVKDAMAIGVGGGRQAIPADELAQQQEIAVRVFLRAKDAGEDFAGGIVDGGVEDEAGAAVLEPGMVAAVHLDEQAGLRHARPAAAMARGAAPTRTANAGGAQQSLHCGSGQVQRFPLGEELGELTIVHADVAAAGEGDEAGPDDLGGPTRGRAPAVAMGQCGEAMLADLRQEATDMTDREAHEPCSVRHGEAPLEELGQDMCSLLLSPAQRDCLPVHAPRVTESLSN